MKSIAFSLVWGKNANNFIEAERRSPIERMAGRKELRELKLIEGYLLSSGEAMNRGRTKTRSS